jgi:hypothetical protein
VPPWGKRLVIVLCLAGITACVLLRPVYRASAKLLIVHVPGGPVDPIIDYAEPPIKDFERSICSQDIRDRAQHRLGRTSEEIRRSLVDVLATDQQRADGSSYILVLAVKSPEKRFARDYANAIADEFLARMEEQRRAQLENGRRALMLEKEELEKRVEIAQEGKDKELERRLLKELNDRLATIDLPQRPRHDISLLERANSPTWPVGAIWRRATFASDNR